MGTLASIGTPFPFKHLKNSEHFGSSWSLPQEEKNMACDGVRELLAQRAEAIVSGFAEKAQRILGAKRAVEGDALAGAGGDTVHSSF